MPPVSPKILAKTLDYTVVVANALRDVASATQVPFVSNACTLTLRIIPMLQNTKFQKDRCLRIVEDIHHVLCILVNLSAYADDIHSPKMLNQIAQYVLTLQKIDSCLRAQRELGTIKRQFKQSELATQFGNCETELKAVLGSFTMKQGVNLASTLVEFSLEAETRHQELLELISSRSGSFDTLSSIGQKSLNNSSGSFSLLPASPKIFHGRESELEQLVHTLLITPARVAILGSGGMGKTTLAMAALHNPGVVDKYPARHFITCDSAHTNDSLVAIIASSIGLEASHGSIRRIIHQFSTGPACLVVLDNFETPWEPVDGRAKVEESLSLLTDIPHLGLLITMRGTERPSKVKWTRPFLRPLSPLLLTAARQNFIEIADEAHHDLEVERLLNITDNVPLAVQLIATVAGSEGCQATLELWELENTAMLSAGYDKDRIWSFLLLLSLMSLLSDGISDIDLAQSKIPIPDLPECKATLIRTSLAYVDHAGQLKVLAPIQEYVHTVRPPSSLLVQPLHAHLNKLLQLWWNFRNGSSSTSSLIPRLVSNLGNLHNVLLHGLNGDFADLAETMHSIILLSRLNMTINFMGCQFYTIDNPTELMDEAVQHFRTNKDLEGEARLYNAAALYYLAHARNREKAQNLYGSAVSVACQCNSGAVQIRAMLGLAMIHWFNGNYSQTLKLAREIHRFSVVAGNIQGELSSIRWQAMCYTLLGDFKHSIQLLGQGLELLAGAGLKGGGDESRLMNSKADAYQLKTEYSEARQIHGVILRQSSAILTPVTHGYVLVNIAFLDIVTGASADIATRNLDAAVSIFRNIQYSRDISFCDLFRADLLLREGDAGEARVEYIRLFAGVKTTEKDIACACLAKLADPANYMHIVTESARWAGVFLAFTMPTSAWNMVAIHQALRCLGDVLARQGADDTALSILTVALEGFTWMDVHQSMAECMRTMGEINFGRGEISKASALWKDAKPLFERSLQSKEVAEMDTRLVKIELPDNEVTPPSHVALDSDDQVELDGDQRGTVKV
ncbi:hypothetical protein K438DRAFT_1962295 [Mycena galopus ATCC 62051]|nr:hypothetical protein K438DRAFT_1962295 [Mycena galopus ATCC 62051]